MITQEQDDLILVCSSTLHDVIVHSVLEIFKKSRDIIEAENKSFDPRSRLRKCLVANDNEGEEPIRCYFFGLHTYENRTGDEDEDFIVFVEDEDGDIDVVKLWKVTFCNNDWTPYNK